MKSVVIALIVAFAAIAGGYAVLSQKETTGIILYGNVDVRQVSLAFEQGGRVTEMLVEEGNRVEKGQVLARQDAVSLRWQHQVAKASTEAQRQALLRLEHGTRPEEIEQAEAQVSALLAEVEAASLYFKRVQDIFKKTGGGGVSKQDVDDARSRLRVLEAQLLVNSKSLQLAKKGPRDEDISEARARLNTAEAETGLIEYHLSQTDLVSPAAGVIRTRLLEPGDMASASRPVYSLAILSPKWVRAYVNGVQLGRIKPGMAAGVIVDSHPGRSISGHIGYISSVAEFTPKPVQTEELRTSLVYEVRVLVDDPEDTLRLGMPATVTIDETPALAAE